MALPSKDKETGVCWCISCNQEIIPADKYCFKCGTRILGTCGENDNPLGKKDLEKDEKSEKYNNSSITTTTSSSDDKNVKIAKKVASNAAWIGGGAAVAVVAAPLAVTAIGFTSAGIAAGSLAASLMSTAWTAGIGIGIISTLQSVGAVGLSASATALVGVTGAGIGKGLKEATDAVGRHINRKCKKCRHRIDTSWNYCSSCGYKLKPNCGQCFIALNGSDKFCSSCGRQQN